MTQKSWVLVLGVCCTVLSACPPSRSVCGNGKVEAKEVCDDGNTSSCDGCAADCQSTDSANCSTDGGMGGGSGGGSTGGGSGGGSVGGGTGGNTGGGSVTPVCQNGTVEGNEECDDMNATPNDGCEPDCTLTPGCGNGKRENAEVCDDGNQVGGDGCEVNCMAFTNTATVKGCIGMNSQLPAGDTCAVTAGDGARLITGVVLTDGVTYVGGQVLVDNTGAITCAACDCTTTPQASTATQLVCPQAIVSPGLINAHDHISFQANPAMSTAERFEHRHDWRTGHDGHTRLNNGGNATNAQVRWAELRQLISGTTSIVGATYTANGNGGLLRNLDTNSTGQMGNITGASGVNSDTFPLDDSSGAEITSGCGYPTVPTTAPGTAAYLAHVSEGIELSANNEFVCLSQAGGVGILSARTGLVHGIALTAADIALTAQTGTSLVWSPRSNVSLYGDTAAIPLYQRLGVNIALGTDWTISGSMNLLRELRCVDSLNSSRFNNTLTDVAMWRIVTANGADATGASASIGRIAVGHLGDLVIFRRKTGLGFHRSIIEADPQDVVMTMRGGKVLYGDQALVATINPSTMCETLDVCGTMKSACVQDELTALTGSNAANTLALLTTANANTYPLFACGQPVGEPSCVPERADSSPIGTNSKNGSTTYTASSTDTDKDGIADGADNCPMVFNPIRPMDNGQQADADADMVGDVCDPCPLNANTTTCTVFDPNDRDRDGIPNTADNCPLQANAMQEDTDTDGKGDLCDACPAISNPGILPCPASIYAVKTGAIATGQRVALNNVLATGAGPNGYFIQVFDTDPEFTTRDYSGLFVYQPASGVSAGDRLDLADGTRAVFNGQVQLTGTGPVDGGARVLSAGNPLPAPVVINPSDVVINDGGLAEKLEGVLVRVDNVTVLDANPDAGPGDRAPINEFVVTGGLRVNDYLYLTSPFPVAGTQYQAIVGVLEYRNGAYKLEPRSAADLITGPAVVTALTPSTVFVREGQSTTLPQPLVVRLSNGELHDVAVTVSSSGPEVTVADGGLIVVPSGQLSAVVPLGGVTATDGGVVTLTATLGTSSQTASVRVLGANDVPRLVALEPGTVNVTAGGTQTFTVRFDLPAATGTAVSIAVMPNTLGVAPLSVTVPADQTTATFDVAIDAAAVALSTGTVTATYGSDTLSSALTVQAIPATANIVISEFSSRGPAGGFDEFVEIYNPTNVATDLSGWKLQTKSAAGTTWTDRVIFPGNTSLASHRFLLTGNSLAASGYAGPPVDFSWLSSGSGLGDTGAIRLIRTVNQTDEVVDAVAFGSTATGGEGTALPAHPGSAMNTRSFERKARAAADEASMNGTGLDVAQGNAQDMNNNATDFYLRTSTVRDPQNSSSPAEP